MKLLNLLLITVASLSLFACNVGDDTNSNDVQEFTKNGVPASGSGSYTITGTATNCRINPANCHVSLTAYSSSGNLNPSVINYAINAQASQTGISNACRNSNANSQSCSFNITEPTITTGNSVSFLFNGTGGNANGRGVPQNAFTIGGGL